MPVKPCLGALERVEQMCPLGRHVALPRLDDELAFRADARDRAEEFLSLPHRVQTVEGGTRGGQQPPLDLEAIRRGPARRRPKLPRFRPSRLTIRTRAH